MSTPAIEARSLSSLTALASNPPAYPRNPTHVRHDPLVLYIARVPGSKDVFLSPMKPRDKVVTVEDITSSLYFLHIEQPEDANLVAPPDFREPDYTQQLSAASNIAPTPAIQRKAVPGAPEAQGGTQLPGRRPLPGTLAPIDNFSSRQNASAGNYSRRSFDTPQYQGDNRQSTSSPRRSPERYRPVSTSLTLIRRDPASGAQWNVARIEEPPAIEVSSSTLQEPGSKRRIGGPMYIDIMNPGYSKFLHSENTGRPALASRASNMPNETYQTEVAPQERSNIFQRRLWMEGLQNSGGGFGHRKKNSYDLNAGRPNSRGSSDVPAPFLTRDDQSYSTIQVSERQTSFRGYVFLSPWNGRCEFVTGAGGGSLKCRHIIPGLQGAPPAALTVSELRFNLPGASYPSTPKGEESSKRSSFFHRGRHNRNGSSVSVNRDLSEDVRNSMDRMDLSLGQEFAGGGFGGKQAKLGKIILEDEGLKMMDLLVAANLALWWRAYEKASTASPRDRGSF